MDVLLVLRSLPSSEKILWPQKSSKVFHTTNVFFSKKFIQQGSAPLLLMISHSSQTSNHICWILSKNFMILQKINRKLTPVKSFFMLLAVNYLGHEIGFNTIKPVQSNIAANHKHFSLTTKIELMSSIGTKNFYLKLIDKLHDNIKCQYHRLPDDVKFHWKIETETPLQQNEISIKRNVTPTLAHTNLTFFIAVDSSLFGVGCVLFRMKQAKIKGILDVNSYVSWFCTTHEGNSVLLIVN